VEGTSLRPPPGPAAVAEFRIRGVATYILFLAALLDDPDFAAGPTAAPGCLPYLADVTVNRPTHRAAVLEVSAHVREAFHCEQSVRQR
jgi:acetyl/propionyl-CoA carboxylase alpha subunit